MAKKVILKDLNDNEILPITRGELIIDSSGKEAFHSNEFLATQSLPGLMSKEDKIKLNSLANTIIDTALSTTSTNPVQNKVVTKAINEALDAAENALETADNALQTANSIKANYLKEAIVNNNTLTIVDLDNNEIDFENTTYPIVSSTEVGLAPKIGTSTSETISNLTNEWVLTSTTGGSPTWRKLPINAFKNDNSNTTYTLDGGIESNKYIVKLTDSNNSSTLAIIEIMSGATSSTDGLIGLVPKPIAGNLNKYLKGDGSWDTPLNNKVTLTNTTTNADYRVLFSESANDTTSTEGSRKSSKLKFNPSTGTLTATTFNGNLDWSKITNKPSAFTPSTHYHPTNQINSLTGYSKAEEASDLTTTDTLNTALGKLEYKADTAYTFYKSILGPDSDDIINKYDEIVDFVDSVAEGTDITDEFVTRKTEQTVTGLKTFLSNSSTTGISLILKNNGWTGNMSTAMDFYNGSNYTVPNARIETKMVGDGKAGGTLIFYTQTKHASTNPNPNGLTERLRIDDKGGTKITGNLAVTGTGDFNNDITLHAGNVDRFINFKYNNGTTYSWRLGYLGSGSGNTNYLVILSAKAAGTSWNNVVTFGNETLEAIFSSYIQANHFISGSGTSDFSAGAVKLDTLHIPTTSGGSIYGVGDNGLILKSNGTTVYWANDSNTWRPVMVNGTEVAASTTDTGTLNLKSGTGITVSGTKVNNITITNAGVRSVTIGTGDNANKLAVNTNGTATYLTIPYATLAAKVMCTASTDDIDRPIVLTNTSNSLYYSTKATINYSTGHIKVGALTSAGQITLYSSSGDSPHLYFLRGTTSDGTYDWDLYVTNGYMKFRYNKTGTWTEVLSLYPGNSTLDGYKILHAGNSSVSGDEGSTWGSSITVQINGVSKTLTIPANPNTWRPITDKYDVTSPSNTTSLSQTGAKSLLRNVRSFKRFLGAATNGGYDLNTLTEGMVHNYGSSAYWRNGPSGMSYGKVLNLKDGSGDSLSAQLAWDIVHNSETDTTGNLWWRASDDGTFTEAKWHRLAYVDDIPSIKTLTFSAGTFAATTYNGSSDVTVKIPNNFNHIGDATSVSVTSGTVKRKVIVTNVKNEGYVSRASIGLSNPANQFSPVIIGVGTNDTGTAFTDYYFHPGGSITDSKGNTYAKTSDIPTIPSLSLGTTTGSGNAVTSITVSGHTITLNKGTTFSTSGHTHYYLATPGDLRSTATTPNSYSNKFIFLGLKTNSTIDSPSSDTYSYLVGLRGWSDSSGGNSWELAFNNTGIYARNGATISWDSWKKVAFTSDIPSVTVSTTGSGNAITSVTTDGHTITFTKGSTFLTSHQSLDNYVTLNTTLTITSVKTFSKQQKFTVAAGTSPFTVTSTTKVTNLNADMTDGLHVHGGRNNEANKIVRTDSSGYIQTGYINTNVATEDDLSCSRLFFEYNNDGYIRKLTPDRFRELIMDPIYLPRLRMRNPSNGTSQQGGIPFPISLKGAGYPVYTDPEFASGNNSVKAYNTSGSGTVTISRIEDNQGSANSSGYILKISTATGTASPGRGGFYQTISSRKNAVFAQIFRAKIPTGFNLVNAENSMGSGYSTHWLTDTEGTGKWEWYVRVTICGTDGTFSSGGHVYLKNLDDPDSLEAVTWYLSYCNLIDLTKGNYDGLRTRYSDYATTAGTANSVAWANVTDKPTIPSFTAKGSETKGVYLSGTNTFATMTYSLNATVNSGTTNRLAYYSGANAINAYTSTIGNFYTPVYINDGVPLESSLAKTVGAVTWGTNCSGYILVYQYGAITILLGYITKIQVSNTSSTNYVFQLPTGARTPVTPCGFVLVQKDGYSEDRNTVIRLSGSYGYCDTNYNDYNPNGSSYYFSAAYI